jgi:hypothetical protein
MYHARADPFRALAQRIVAMPSRGKGSSRRMAGAATSAAAF